MPTEAQINANRLNAQKSTGPVTEEGKNQSKFNNLKHGLYARTLVLPAESQDEFDALAVALREEWQPQTLSEEILVDDLLAARWQVQRSYLYEHMLLAKPTLDLKLAETLQRYQQRAKNAYHRAYGELVRIRQSRQPAVAAAPNLKREAAKPAPRPANSAAIPPVLPVNLPQPPLANGNGHHPPPAL